MQPELQGSYKDTCNDIAKQKQKHNFGYLYFSDAGNGYFPSRKKQSGYQKQGNHPEHIEKISQHCSYIHKNVERGISVLIDDTKKKMIHWLANCLF